MRNMVDKLYARAADAKVVKRVKLMRQGLSLDETRPKRWRQQTLTHDDDE